VIRISKLTAETQRTQRAAEIKKNSLEENLQGSREKRREIFTVSDFNA
jgi:hypothetical protein